MKNTSNIENPTKPRLFRAYLPASQGLRQLPALLKNKYLISFVAFCALMLFLDKNDLFTQMDRVKELRQLRQSKAYYTAKIESERKELEGLKHNPAVIEKYAREKYFMKRDNEELFIVPENYEIPKN